MRKTILILCLLLLPLVLGAKYYPSTIILQGNSTGGGGGGNVTPVRGVPPYLYNQTIGGVVNIFLNESTLNNNLSGLGGGGAGNCSGTGSCENITYLDYLNRGNLNVTGYMHSSFYLADSLGFNLTDDGSNLILETNVEGNNYFSIGTDGGFMQIYSNPNPANGYLLYTVTETQGADTFVNIYEGGTGHNRFWDSGSMRIGGSESYLCSPMAQFVDCNTPTTGADLAVQDQIEVGRGAFFGNGSFNISNSGNITTAGYLYAHNTILTHNWSNVTIDESQVTDLEHINNCSGFGSCSTIAYNNSNSTFDIIHAKNRLQFDNTGLNFTNDGKFQCPSCVFQWRSYTDSNNFMRLRDASGNNLWRVDTVNSINYFANEFRLTNLAGSSNRLIIVDETTEVDLSTTVGMSIRPTQYFNVSVGTEEVFTAGQDDINISSNGNSIIINSTGIFFILT